MHIRLNIINLVFKNTNNIYIYIYIYLYKLLKNNSVLQNIPVFRFGLVNEIRAIYPVSNIL